MRCFDHLFAIDTPAGIVNERACYLKKNNARLRYAADSKKVRYGRWQWHSVYRDVPHGAPVPRHITDRVRTDPANYGINAALLVLEPSMDEYLLVSDRLAADPHIRQLIACFRWPDMQFLTLWWSGAWHNVDACFAGIGGYPELSVLFGTHFAGLKPWQTGHKSVATRFFRFPDFQRWYDDYLLMLDSVPALRHNPRLEKLGKRVAALCGRSMERGA